MRFTDCAHWTQLSRTVTRRQSNEFQFVLYNLSVTPALFCLAVDWIMSRCSGSLGITLDGAVFTDLDYADDAVLLAQDSGRCQAELKHFDDTANTMGLHTSWEKTKLQKTGYGPPPQSVSVDGHPVEVTDKFIYLGSTVDSTGYYSCLLYTSDAADE